jgi:GT2 family glycosyltransferase
MNYESWRSSQTRIREAVGRSRPRLPRLTPSEAVSQFTARAGAPVGTPLVSVIVVCWNAQQVLARCLDCLFEQDHPNYELIVVDDGSDDDTVGVAERARARGELKLVRSARNRGCPSARNLGLRHAGGEIVAFVDADGFAAPNWLSRVTERFAGDQTIGGVASTVFFDDNPLVINGAGGTVNRQGWAADLAMGQSLESAEIVDQALYPMGCGMAISRAALERVGPFDDRMLNYYDDVDYGTRLWRAGFRVVVAADAWIDHGSGDEESAGKRLLCERHRMRVVLKHASADLQEWAVNELIAWRRATREVRIRKVRALAWNLRHLTSVLAYRRRQRAAATAPARLVDPSWGDGFPVGVTPRSHPRPELAREGLEMADADSQALLPYGWFPAERVNGRSYRWAARRASALVELRRTADRFRIDFAHVPVDVGGVLVELRRLDSSDPVSSVWHTRLLWQYMAHSVENHPLDLAPGIYEVLFTAEDVWSSPPAETRSLAFSLTSVSFSAAPRLPVGVLDMASPDVEGQLVSGWFEPEHDGARAYRWAGCAGNALVRLEELVRSIQIVYRLPPGPAGKLTVAMRSPDGDGASSTIELSSADADADAGGWREADVGLQLAPGEYVLSLEAEQTWSNPGGVDPTLWPENRTLGFALAAVRFSRAARSSSSAA